MLLAVQVGFRLPKYLLTKISFVALTWVVQMSAIVKVFRCRPCRDDRFPAMCGLRRHTSERGSRETPNVTFLWGISGRDCLQSVGDGGCDTR